MQYKKTLHLVIGVIVTIIVWSVGFVYAEDGSRVNPKLANYYLGELDNSPEFVSKLSKYDILILAPAQIKTKRSALARIKVRNPDIIILAYIPSQSYNTKYWNSDEVFCNLGNIRGDWWLRDPSGNIIRPWANLKAINMHPDWSEHLLHFTKEHISSMRYVDGFMFDMVSHNISWMNRGDIDLDLDGKQDFSYMADKLWLERTAYFLSRARSLFPNEIIIINGSSHNSFQKYINGRMFETFPTPWEMGGSWSDSMRSLENNIELNQRPKVMVLNSNTENTGNYTDYKKVRFGLVSSLLEDDVYFSFDYGDEDHGQLLWYDEFGINLGSAIGPSNSENGLLTYQPDVWTRQYENGMAVLNSTKNEERIELDGEYEKIHGTQDPIVNDGTIVSELNIGSNDGLILLKTFLSLEDVLFINGSFARFFRMDSSRARNGFFAFDSDYRGGYEIIKSDLDGNGKKDLLIVGKTKITAWRDDGQLFMKLYPFGAMYQGELNVAVGDLNGDRRMEVVVAPSEGYNFPVKLYTRHGRSMKKDWYPMGKGYLGGYDTAIGNLKDSRWGHIVLSTKRKNSAYIQIYDYEGFMLDEISEFGMQGLTFGNNVNVAVGDVSGDGIDEIVVGAGQGRGPVVGVFDIEGKLVNDVFNAYSTMFTTGIDVAVSDVDFDGVDEIVTYSFGLGL